LLKTGLVYVPIDNEAPTERKRFIISDSGAALAIVADYNEQIDIQQFQVGDIHKILSSSSLERTSLAPNDIAYIMYTSGSTGNPKGVIINHSALHDYVVTFSEYFQLDHTDKVLQQSSLAFDTSVEEIFPILTTGGTLVISGSNKDFNTMLTECQEHGVTILSTNPFLIKHLNQYDISFDLKLRILISGGEVLKSDYVPNLIHKYSLFNTYGPTESTVCATFHKVSSLEHPIPIGKPISNRSVLILDNGQLLPPGASGEICLSGSGLAIGYLNNQTLTDKSFVHINGERYYKTGDLGKWDGSGNLVFLGRKDDQLSYRGFRIEAEEIGKTVRFFFDSIEDSFICIREINEQPILVAYLISKTPVDTSIINKKLATKLPAYMLPTEYVTMDQFPKLPNGKINRKLLPLPKRSEAIGREFKAASSPLEKEVLSIWKNLLNLNEIDCETSFFELGGHSLLANQFVSIIRDQKKIDIPLADFYSDPTIKAISLLIATKAQDGIKIERAPQSEFYPLS
jgi:amino acid adenylation domain-containing protein